MICNSLSVVNMSDQRAALTEQKGTVLRSCYSAVLGAADARYDVRGYVLSELVKSCLKNRARIPQSSRAYCDSYVQPEVFTYLEFLTRCLLFGPGGRFSPHEYRYRLNN